MAPLAGSVAPEAQLWELFGRIVAAFAELWGVEFIRQNLDTSKHLAASVASSIWLGIAVGAPIIGYTATKLGRYRDILRVTSIIGCIATHSHL